MFDERRDHEEQSKNSAGDRPPARRHRWRDQEAAKVREELFDAVNRIKEFEAVDHIKSASRKSFTAP